MAELTPGTQVFDYTIERLVGRGGFGAVYVARDTRLERRVALKLLEPHLAADPDARRRFIDESRLAASLDHPNIVPIYEAGERDGQLYLAMRYVSGPDLAGLLDRDGALEPIRAGRIVSQVASALDAAHAAGLVHRDVKPGNVLLAPGTDSTDHAYLTDFGLSKRVGGGGAVSQTQAGRFVGTVGYVAPEQVKGRTVDHRADVYSLGCLAFHILTGHQPFERDSEIGTLMAHAEDPPPSIHEALPDVADRVDPAIAKAMAKDPAARYASAGAFAADLTAALSSRQPGAVVTRGFLFADLRGYTAFIEAHGDEAAVRLLDAFRRMVRLVVSRSGGAEVKTEGDSFYVVFPSASAAVQGGIGIVAAAAAETEQRPELPISVGVGVHAGESSEWVEGYVGSAVNIAARLCAQAEPGEVLVSDTVRTLIRTSSDVGFDERGTRALKGIDEPIAVWAAHPAGAGPRVAARGAARRRDRARLGIGVLAVLALGALALIGVFVLGSDDGPRAATTTDGRLAYWEWVGGNSFHVTDADGSRDVEIFVDGGAVGNLSWSPDGQRVAFTTEDGALWVSHADGSDQTRVLDREDLHAVGVLWSPNGDELTVTLATPPGETLEDLYLSQDSFSHAVVRPDGSGFQELDAGLPGGGPCDSAASWSPDGSQFLFLRPEGDDCQGTPHLWIAGKDGSDARRLLKTALLGEWDHAWAPDGQRIAFVMDTHDDPRRPPEQAIALTGPEGTSVDVLHGGQPANRAQTEAHRIYGSLSWSPDGTRLAFSGDDNRVWIMNVDSRELAPLTGETEWGAAVAWGPPGSGGPDSPVMPAQPSPSTPESLPAASTLSGLREAGWIVGVTPSAELPFPLVMLVSADGTRSQVVRLPEANRGCCYDPSISPDGHWLVVTDRLPALSIPADYDGPGQLWVSRLDGSDARVLVGPNQGTGPHGAASWSPDGSSIAFTMMRRNEEAGGSYDYSIATIPVAGGEIEQLTAPSPTEVRDPTWSADGGRVAFVRVEKLDERHQALSIWEVDIQDGDERLLAQDPGHDTDDPQWSPVAASLAYTTIDPTGTLFDIEISSGDGRAVDRLTHDGQSRGPVWSPDGQWIAFQRADGQAVVTRADGRQQALLLPDYRATSFTGEEGGFTPTGWGPSQPDVAPP